MSLGSVLVPVGILALVWMGVLPASMSGPDRLGVVPWEGQAEQRVDCHGCGSIGSVVVGHRTFHSAVARRTHFSGRPRTNLPSSS